MIVAGVVNSLLAAAMISLSILTIAILPIDEFLARLPSITFMLIISFASTSSVSCVAVCCASSFPRLSACWRKMFCVLWLLINQNTHIDSNNSRQTAVANFREI